MDRWGNFFEYYSDMIRTILKILATNITGAIKKSEQFVGILRQLPKNIKKLGYQIYFKIF